MKSFLVGAAAGASLLASIGAHAATVTVDATDVIYAAGGNSSSSSVGGTDPVALSVSGGETLSFSVSGSVILNIGSGNSSNDPDGVGAATSQSSNSGAGSISGIVAPNAGYLVGVFVPVGGPTGSAPTSLNFQTLGTSFASLSPELDQVFFIGDGLTGDGTGTTQTFIAPTGTGTLYLGISDACGYNGGPSCYGDNSGSFEVSVSGVGGVPETSTWAMMLLGFAGLGFAGYRAARKETPAASLAA